VSRFPWNAALFDCWITIGLEERDNCFLSKDATWLARAIMNVAVFDE